MVLAATWRVGLDGCFAGSSAVRHVTPAFWGCLLYRVMLRLRCPACVCNINAFSMGVVSCAVNSSTAGQVFV